jgi:hypothetical protein
MSIFPTFSELETEKLDKEEVYQEMAKNGLLLKKVLFSSQERQNTIMFHGKRTKRVVVTFICLIFSQAV